MMRVDENNGGDQRKIRFAIVVDDERFYLADALRQFFARIPNEYELVSAVVLKYYYARPNRSQWIKARNIIKVFGPRVFARIVWRFVIGWVMTSKSVAAAFRNHGVPVLASVEDVNAPKTIQYLAQFNPDLIVAIGVNSLFQRPLREMARLGCINVHTGIRPEHRGQTAIFWALADGDAETGVTVHYIDDGVDSGRVIATSRYRITVRSFDRLLRDLRALSMDTLVEAFSILLNERGQKYQEHPPAQVSYRSQPDLQDMMAFAKAGNSIF